MTHSLHFLRPEWFWGFIPLMLLAYFFLRQTNVTRVWEKACDKPLLLHLINTKHHDAEKHAKYHFLAASAFMLIALTGPSVKQLPVPTYHVAHPRVIILDLSQTMLQDDVKPNRLMRAKFKLHDLLQTQDQGQFGLVVYTGEAFIASPLTLDAQTIDALVDQLSPDIMPVGGENLAEAIKEGEKLIKQSGITHGDLLVLTGTPPTLAAIQAAKKAAAHQIRTSILAIHGNHIKQDAFKALAHAGQGQYLMFSHHDKDIKSWLAEEKITHEYQANHHQSMPTWRDDGRWFLIPACLCLLPAFRRNWLLRIQS